ncbi:MAG TPA: methyltransferase domain-containing protein [Ramlibacter sp.]|nr:methyltransferase domain-containing protein [Ramlibacter sp.]
MTADVSPQEPQPHGQPACRHLQMRDYYASRAPEYDQVYLKPERQADLHDIRQWLPTVFKGKSVLEVACGTGYWTQYLAPVAAGMVAVDSSPETLRIAQTRARPEDVDFVTGDAYRLPVAAGGFQSAFAGFWFSHVPKERVPEFLANLHMALVPGAKVVFLDNRFVEGSSTPISEHDEQGNTYQIRHLADGSSHRVLKNFPSELDLRRAVETIGADFRFHEWQYFWAVEYAAAKP